MKTARSSLRAIVPILACAVCLLTAPTLADDSKAKDSTYDVRVLDSPGIVIVTTKKPDTAKADTTKPKSGHSDFHFDSPENDSGRDLDSLVEFARTLGEEAKPESVDTLCTLWRSHRSTRVREAAALALEKIGLEHLGRCLMSCLDSISDPDARYGIFDALGRIQYPGALPAALEILTHDAKDTYWHSVFVFGQMGDMAVPGLIGKVGDEDYNTRTNAIRVLGQYMLAPEAADVFMAQFWRETDADNRIMILGSLEHMQIDFDSLAVFMKQVVAKSGDKEAVTFAQEALAGFAQMPEILKQGRAMMQPSPETFKAVYDSLWESYGKRGDYQTLAKASTAADEPALKKLRERILQRGSDEAFYDYRKVTMAIFMNRMLARMK